MKTQIVRLLYRHRALWKRLLPLGRPILLRLPGFRLYVRLDDWAVGARIAIKRVYEPHVVRVMCPFLQPGAVVVDVGANIGYYTLLAACAVGATGKVLAFEPSQDNCTLLRMSLQANRLTNVSLATCAVADVEGVVGYGMDDSNGRISRDDPARARFQVPAVTLDAALAQELRIDLIKLDIEGAEGRALLGMRQLLQRHRPVLFSEFSPYALPATSGMSPEAFLALLRGEGYDIFVIPRQGTQDTTPQTDQQIMDHFAPPSRLDHIDLVAFPRPIR